MGHDWTTSECSHVPDGFGLDGRRSNLGTLNDEPPTTQENNMISTEDRLELVEKSLAKQKRATLILGCFLVAAISWGGAAEVQRAEQMKISNWPSFEKLKLDPVEITTGTVLGRPAPMLIRVVDRSGADVDFK